jgi:signal transduction histidine kinase
MILFALIVLAGALAAGFAATAVVMRLRSLRARLLGALLVAAALPLAVVLASGLVMFESEHDLTVLAVVASSTAVAVGAAIALMRGVSKPLENVSAAAHEIAAGDLTARAPRTGVAETDELAESFNRMAESVQSLFDARKQLVAWASHDLRTPLAAMKAMLEAVEDGVSTMDEYLPEMRQQLDRLAALVDDLFELAMIESSALELEYAEVRIGDLIAAGVRGFEGQAHAAGVELSTSVSEPDMRVRCAPDAVERVLMNLLTNALRHTPADGSVAISADRVRDDLQVRVVDNGAGLRPGEAERVFDHFFRGEAARASDGAGLGLAIAKGLVEAQGGEIWAESRPGGGAVFGFRLPATA